MIQRHGFRVNDIPAWEVCADASDYGLPIVILLHGFGCSKETHLDEADQLARNGFRVLLPDAFLHGERALAELEAVSPFKKVERMDEIYLRTAETIDPLIAHCKRRGDSNDVRVGLIGASLGGCSILHYITDNRNPSVKAAVVLLASPYWENHLRQTAAQLPEFGEFLRQDLLERIRKVEPSQFLEKAKDFPLLFLSGVADELVPFADVQRGFSELRERTEQKSHVALVAFDGVDHQTTPEMFEKANQWLVAHLKV